MRKTQDGHRCTRGALPIAQAVSFRTLGRCPDGVITSPRSPFPAVSGRDAQQQYAVGGGGGLETLFLSVYADVLLAPDVAEGLFTPHAK